MRIGTAWEDITPSKPVHLLGQMHVRLGEYKRDPLTVNAVVLDDGTSRVALVSIDVCVLPKERVDSLRAACADSIAPESVIIAATHTHVAPCTANLVGDICPEFLETLEGAVARAVRAAIGDLEEADFFAGAGDIEHMGWNRRGLHRDGAGGMYWGSWREGYVGIEGPRDGSVPVVFARRPDGSVKAVITGFTTHPNTLEGESFYSADIPGEVRRVLRAVLGEGVGVVYFTGAAGNTAPSIMENNVENIQPWRGEQGLRRSGQYLGGEILKTIANQVNPMPNPVLRHAHTEISIPIRPWDEDSDFSEFGGGMLEFFENSKADWDRMLREESPVAAPLDVVRIGDAALCFNPAELYSEFGLAMKENSPARVTLVSELANAWIGYVPTPQAILHGGYSAQSSWVTKLVPDAGWTIVEKTRELLVEAFAEG
jgi:hypothetical protein